MLNQTTTPTDHWSYSVLPPSGDSATGTNVSRDTACFNDTDVNILTTNIFNYQVSLSAVAVVTHGYVCTDDYTSYKLWGQIVL